MATMVKAKKVAPGLEGYDDTIAAPTTGVMPGGAAPDVQGSSFVNYGRYFNANAEKSGAMATRLTDATQKKARDLAAAQKKASDDFYTGLNAHKGSEYTGQTIQAPSESTAPNVGQSNHGTPGAITPEEAQARANQTYDGPMELAGYEDLVGQSSKLDSDVTALQSAEGRQALLSDAYKTSLNSRASRLNAALTGTAGQTGFGRLEGMYGGSTRRLSDAQALAKRLATGASQDASANAQQWKDALGGYQKDKAALDATRLADAKKRADEQAATHKTKSLDDYLTPSAAYGMSAVANSTDPISALWSGISGGDDTPVDRVTDFFEKSYDKPIGDRHSAYPAFAPYSREYQTKIYNSMTQAEADALERMTKKEQAQWVYNRGTMLGMQMGPGPTFRSI